MTAQADHGDFITWEPRYGVWIALMEDGETQKALAERLGWEPSKLSRIITGRAKRPSIDEWEQIAVAQGRNLSWYLNPPKRGPDGAPIIHVPVWFRRPIEQTVRTVSLAA